MKPWEICLKEAEIEVGNPCKKEAILNMAHNIWYFYHRKLYRHIDYITFNNVIKYELSNCSDYDIVSLNIKSKILQYEKHSNCK